MNDSQEVKREEVKRPIVITIFCLFVIFVHGGDLIRSFVPDRFIDLVSNYPLWFLLLLFFLIYPAEIYSVIEIWRMKVRGLVLFGLLQIIWMSIWIYYFNVFPKIGQVALFVIYLVISIVYYNDMEKYPSRNT